MTKKQKAALAEVAALKAKFLEYFRQLPVQKLGASYIGKNEDTITDWKKADPTFNDQVESAKSEWALNNSKLVRSKEWLLERIMKDHFAPRSPLLDEEGKPIPILDALHNNNSSKEAGQTNKED